MARRILIAVSPDGKHRIRSLLRDFDLHWADDLRSLLKLLDQAAWHVVIVGAHFDESNTLGVLANVVERAPHAIVICVRASAGALSESSLHGLQLASRELGARCFVDLTNGPEEALRNELLAALDV